MGFPIIPLAVVGTALSSVGVYLYTHAQTRGRLVAEGRHFAGSVTGYVTRFFEGREKAVVKGANVMTTALHVPDRERCEALTRSGKRCRARTSKVLPIQDHLGVRQEYGLCWRHARAHEEGAPLALSSQPGSEQRPEPHKHGSASP